MGRVWVRRRGRGRLPWVCAWNDRDEKRHQKAFASRAEAERMQSRMLTELGEPAPPPAVDVGITVREYASHWLSSCAQGLKRATLESYLSNLNVHILPALGRLPVRELHQQHVAQVLVEMLKSGQYKVTTVHSVYRTVRRMLSRAKWDGVVTGNAIRGLWRELPVPVAERRLRRGRVPGDVPAMSRDQLQLFLLAGWADARHRLLWLTIAKTGLRVGEALGLQLGDVDLAAAEIHVRRNLGASGAGLSLADRLGTPKSGRTRTVDLGGELVLLLRTLVQRRKAEVLQAGQGDDPKAWLWQLPEGGPLDESRVRKAFKACLKEAGLPLRFGPHSLRHTYASLMLAAGAPLVWVSQQLGHSSPQVTLDFYSWALPSGGKKDASLLDSRLPLAATAEGGGAADPMSTRAGETASPAGSAGDDRESGQIAVVTAGDQKGGFRVLDERERYKGRGLKSVDAHGVKAWSRRRDLNPGPADYEDTARDQKAKPTKLSPAKAGSRKR